MNEDPEVFNDNVSDFTRDLQARYLIKLRNGVPEMKAAREVGFEPSAIKAYRNENPLFEEEVSEALKEADEEVLASIRAAAIRGEPWAGRLYGPKLGLSEKESGDKTQVNVFNGVPLEGNPIERIMAMQKAVLDRPNAELPPPVIDISLDDVE